MQNSKDLELIELASFFDHTNLSLQASNDDIFSLCEEAKKYQFKSVIVYPSSILECKYMLEGTSVKVGTVIGFPHGRCSTEAKKADIEASAEQGVSEVDIVADYFLLKDGVYKAVEAEIEELVTLSKSLNLTTKIIVETCELDIDSKLAALEICENAGADYIKTSTGMGKSGAQVNDVILFSVHRQKNIKIKASGGIKTLSQACALINAGADRIGTSSSVSIIEEYLGRYGKNQTITG